MSSTEPSCESDNTRDCTIKEYDTLSHSIAFCDVYDTSGSVWPMQPFPSTEFLYRYSSSDLRAARTAWNLFEQVEAQDAATRVRLAPTAPWDPPSANIQTPSTWYQFRSNEERLIYLRGKALHSELCQGFRWTPQRNRGITSPPVNVYPLKIV